MAVHDVLDMLKPTGTVSIPEPVPPITATLSPTQTFLPPLPTPYPSGIPGRGQLHFDGAGHFGHVVFWVVFGIFAISTLAYFVLMLRVPKASRLFHWITAFVTMIAAISYYAMATNLGAVWVAHGRHAHTLHQVFIARYVDWFLTTPLLLIDLSLLAGLPFFDIFLLVLADAGMIVTGLIGAVGYRKHWHSSFRWGFFTFSSLFFLWIMYVLVMDGRKSAYARATRVGQLFSFLAIWTVLVWTAYPIVAGLGEYTGTISARAELLAFAILDVLAKGVFGFVLLTGHAMYAEADVPITDSWIEPRGATYAIVLPDEPDA